MNLYMYLGENRAQSANFFGKTNSTILKALYIQYFFIKFYDNQIYENIEDLLLLFAYFVERLFRKKLCRKPIKSFKG